MNLRELFEFSLFVGLVALLLLVLFGAIRFRPSKLKGVPWRERMRRFGRFILVRLPIAFGCALAVFVLGAAALTLNSHRPPADSDPVLLVPPGTRHAVVTLDLSDCGDSVSGSVRLEGARGPAIGPARFYTDQNGWRKLELRSEGRIARTAFEEPDPTQKRSLLSCYLQLPVVKGASKGYGVRLQLSEMMEVDRDSSVPAPGGYSAGRWIWSCPAGRGCSSFAAINYSVESGSQQVIILVLASVFGALIALLVGEVLIKWSRGRSENPSEDGS